MYLHERHGGGGREPFVILVACTCERMFKAALRYSHAAVISDQTLVLKISPLAVLASAW